MKKLNFLLLVTITMMFSYSHAQMDWIDFDNNAEGEQPPELTMLNDSTIRVEFFGTNRFQKNINDTIYDVLRLPGKNGRTVDLGLPELPTKACFIEIVVDTPNITVLSEDYILIENVYVKPAQENYDTVETAQGLPFVKSHSTYNENVFYPEGNVMIGMPLIIRDHKISSLVFYPIQFNPVTKQLKVFKHIEVIVHGAGSIESDKDNSYFDSFLNGLVLNYSIKSNTDNIIDLMIITPDEYYSTLLPFKDWKEQVGIRTSIFTRTDVENAGHSWIADTNETDYLYEGIDAFIKNYYDTAGVLTPEFLLLVGETDPETPEMPTHYWTPADAMIYGFTEPTDYYYTTMDINPFSSINDTSGILDYSDIFGSRISVDDTVELRTVLNKIIDYEKNPYIEQTEWYNTINLSAEYEYLFEVPPVPPGSYCDCIENVYFLYTSYMLGEYFDDFYNIDKVFHNDAFIFHPEWDTICWEWAEQLPPGIPFIENENDATDAVIQSINNGCFLVNHRDHGESKNAHLDYVDGWSHPSFDSSHISQLNNDKMLPVMFSLNCMTGWFDGATETQYTDTLQSWQTGNFDCFGELLLSEDSGGVVGFIGATRNTKSGYNDELCYGMFDAIWEDFDPFNNEIQTPIYKLGAIKEYGLLYMFNKYFLRNATTNYNYPLFTPTGLKNRKQFEKFHVLGDPTLEIWTGVPQPLYVYIDYDQNLITVYDENDQVIPQAKVVLQRGDDYQVRMTNENGQVLSTMLNYYNVEVSALKHNYIPWYTTIISQTQQWPADEDVRGNIIVTNNSELTFPADVEIPKYARIVVTEGATLEIKPNMEVDFNNHYCDILSFGDLTIGTGATIEMSGTGTEPAIIHLLNEGLDYSYSDVSFSKCRITGIPKSLNISNNSTFLYGGIQIEKANVSVSGTNFTNARFNARSARDKSGYVHITGNCNFTSAGNSIRISDYPNFNIDNCNIINCDDAIRLYNCGSGTLLQKISNNTISQNTATGILVYNTSVDILDNIIENNGYGIKCFNKSKVHLEGDNVNVTQEIKNNDSFEVYASAGSFPHFFRSNLVMDDYNPPGDPMVKYSGTEGALDVRKNCWGTGYNLQNDLDPYESYIWDPVWECMSGSGSGMGSDAESAYFAAMDNVEAEDYAGAKIGFQEIVVQYPTTKYAQASLKELFSLEAFLDNDYSVLKSYYNSEPNITNNPDLEKLAEFLINFCEIKLENYPTAIAWFENIIQNPETMEDSIFAIIDLGYTYFLMENGGLKSAYAGNLTEHIPASINQFTEKRDYLLSLLPEDTEKALPTESLNSLKEGELLQNIPNPFKGTTEIWYKLGKGSDVKISIHNNSGQLIRSFDLGKKTKGNHYIEFNGNDLPDGIYFYSISINGKTTDSKKMTIIK